MNYNELKSSIKKQLTTDETAIYDYKKCDTCSSFICNNCSRCTNPLIECVTQNFVKHSNQINLRESYHSINYINNMFSINNVLSSFKSFKRMKQLLIYIYIIIGIISFCSICMPEYFFYSIYGIIILNIVLSIIFYCVMKCKIIKIKRKLKIN